MVYCTAIIKTIGDELSAINIYIYTNHNRDVIMSAMASPITGVSIIFLIICSGADQRKRQSSASLAYVRGNPRQPVNSPRKGPVTRKMFSFDDVIMDVLIKLQLHRNSMHTMKYLTMMRNFDTLCHTSSAYQTNKRTHILYIYIYIPSSCTRVWNWASMGVCGGVTSSLC